MKLIVGLGNPGDLYLDTRHNFGSLIIRVLSKQHKVSLKKDPRTLSLCARVTLEGEKVILAIPLIFMNVSGGAVRALLKRYKLGPQDLLVICDDLDLELGRLKIRPRGSSGGHRGLESIINSLNSREFARLRLGIGRPPSGGIRQADYVLSGFNRKEEKQIRDITTRALECCEVWVTQGIEKSMNTFNRRSVK
jgi:PTH1 family peptidyl-tRNA hydrolase